MALRSGGMANAPFLLCALQSHLVLPKQGAAAAERYALRDVLQLVWLILTESEHCRRSVTEPHLPSPPNDGGGPTCAEVLPRLMDLVEQLASRAAPSSAAILCSALGSLGVLFWCERLVSLSRFCDWICPASCTSGITPQPVFSRLLAVTMPPSVRARALELLRAVLQREAAFECFVAPAQRAPREAAPNAALQLALALNATDEEQPQMQPQPHPAAEPAQAAPPPLRALD